MKKPLIFSLVFVLLATSVLALGPRTHTQWLNEVCADSSWTSPDKELCCVKQQDACYIGMTSTDRDVFHYVSDFKKYAKDHSWATYFNCRQQAALANSERDMAYCVGLGIHLTMDGVSHNSMIPAQVVTWKTISEPIAHIVLESGLDDKYAATDAQNGRYFTTSNVDYFCRSPNSIATRSTGVQSTWECGALADAVANGANYQSKVFIAGPVMNFVYQGFIKISGLFPLINWEPYHQEALTLVKGTLQGSYPTVEYPDPTGYEALDIANYGYKLTTSLIVVGLAIAVLYFIVKLLFFK